MSTNWHHIDELRENWILLRLGQTNEGESDRLTFWELAVGNADDVVRSVAGEVPTTSEDDANLLDNLLLTLDQYRRVDSDHAPLLITPDCETLRQLRAALLAREDTLEAIVSLRGFRHIAIEQQLQDCFGHDLEACPHAPRSDTESSPRPPETSHGVLQPSPRLTQLWELWERMFALLPPEAVRGTPL